MLYYITQQHRLYSVVLVIPREIWLFIHTIVIVYLIKDLLLKIKHSHRLALGEVHTVTIGLIIVLLLNASIVGSTYVDQTRVVYGIPGLDIKQYFDLEKSILFIEIESNKIYILLNATCFISNITLNNNAISVYNRFNDRNNKIVNNQNSKKIMYLDTLIENNTVKVFIPIDLYYEIYNKLKIEPRFINYKNISALSYIPVSCTLFLDKGILELDTFIELKWRELGISFYNNTIVLENSNPIDLSVKVFIVDTVSGSTIYVQELTINRLSNSIVQTPLLEKKHRLYIQYVFLGVLRSVVYSID